MKILSYRLLALASLVLLGSPAGAITIGSSGYRGESQIQYYEPIGQTFEAAGTVLESFVFRFVPINSILAPNVPIVLSIYEGVGSEGSLLWSREMMLPDGFEGTRAFEFSSLGEALSVGDTYSAMLASESAYWAVAIAGVNPDFSDDTYPAGSGVFAGELRPSQDLWFRATFSGGDPKGVPDSGATGALCAIALIAAIALRPKR